MENVSIVAAMPILPFGEFSSRRTVPRHFARRVITSKLRGENHLQFNLSCCNRPFAGYKVNSSRTHNTRDGVNLGLVLRATHRCPCFSDGGTDESVACNFARSATTYTARQCSATEFPRLAAICYSNIDDSTILNANGSTIGWGWRSTSSCAGGSGTASQKMY
jgi:hypothetical protein